MLGLYTGEQIDNISRTVSEVFGQSDVGKVILRFGYMPPNSTHEPDLMPPISIPSWFLDTDVYTDFLEPKILQVSKIDKQVKQMAERVYGIFRWAVNDEFLRTCGGEI